MPYDKELDKVLWSESAEFERTKITVSIYSYNEGMPKIQLSRENKKADGEWGWAKLGRMAKPEAEAIMPLIQKAIESMD